MAARVIAPPPLIYGLGLTLGFALDAALPDASLQPGVRWGVGGTLLALALVLLRWWLRSFRRAGTPIRPTLLALPAVVLVVQEGVIKREERYLERRFGSEYLAFKAERRRWL